MGLRQLQKSVKRAENGRVSNGKKDTKKMVKNVKKVDSEALWEEFKEHCNGLDYVEAVDQ